MTQLRILLVTANFRPSVGGVERYVEILGGGLVARGHDVTVLTATAGGSDLVDGMRVVRVPASGVLRSRLNVPYPLPEPVSLLRELRRLVRWADVVNAHDALYATTVTALTTARALRVPSMLTQHVGFVPQRRGALDLAQRIAIETVGRSAKLATKVVAYNPAVAEWAERTWRLRRVEVIAPGVPDAPFVDRAAVRRQFGLTEDRFIALFAGRDVPKKGLDAFLGASDPAYELVAITDRPARRAPEGTRILPFVEPERFRELLAAVDAFVLPSEGEGFPLALQEALVTGIPCVVTPGPGYDRYLRDGEALHVLPEPDAISAALRLLASDESRRTELSDRARAAGRREFSVDHFVAAYVDAFRAAVSVANSDR